MTKLCALVAVACALLPSAGYASCTVSGTIPEVVVFSTGATIDVRANAPGATTYIFTTTNAFFSTAALVAQSSHMHVTVYGNRTACGAVSGGESTGGNVSIIDVSP
jgi:hypothetical protein